MSEIDQGVLEALSKQVAADVAGGLGIILLRIGEQTGLFAALAQGPATSVELAERAGLAERYVREWASAMAAACYIAYDPAAAEFSLSPEQEEVFARPGAARYAPPYGDLLVAIAHDEALVTEAFRTGEGIPWGAHHGCLFCSTERLTGQMVVPQLIHNWLPQIAGDLPPAPRVADIGCGRGKAALALAKAFPQAEVHGFDLHEPSIAYARDMAAREGIGNAHYVVGPAEAASGSGFDLAVIIDALHDMGDPVGVAANVRTMLKPGGRFLVIEPYAGDRLEDNLTLSGRVAYAASTCICTPASLSQPGRAALGAQAGYARLRDVLERAGYRRIEPVQNEPYNIVIAAIA